MFPISFRLKFCTALFFFNKSPNQVFPSLPIQKLKEGHLLITDTEAIAVEHVSQQIMIIIIIA